MELPRYSVRERSTTQRRLSIDFQLFQHGLDQVVDFDNVHHRRQGKLKDLDGILGTDVESVVTHGDAERLSAILP